MGLLEIARNQKRDFGVIHFSGDHQPDQLRVDYFLKDEPYNVERLIEMAEYFESGGTNFQAPLTRAKQIIDKHKSFSTADVLMVTDGESAISNKFRDDFNIWLKEKKVTMFSILIDEGYSSTATLKEFTKPENIFKLSNLKQDSQDKMANQIFDLI